MHTCDEVTLVVNNCKEAAGEGEDTEVSRSIVLLIGTSRPMAVTVSANA